MSEKTTAKNETAASELALLEEKIRQLEDRLIKSEETAKERNERVVVNAANPAYGPEARRTAESFMKELVPVKLFKDGDAYKDDLTVLVNGKSWLIQRGVEVMVPRYVKAVIDQHEQQDTLSNEMIRAEAERYARESARVAAGYV